MAEPSRKLERMVVCTRAATRRLKATTQIALVGPKTAASTPPRAGPRISAADDIEPRKPLAAASRSRPTRAGTAPKTAASENTNAVADRSPTT